MYQNKEERQVRKNPKFSVIIPVYNVEKYLKDCLDSIVNQTFTDFEVICINDESTDGSLEILNQYADKDERFVVITQKNQGQGVARNDAIKIAKGDYIVFLDPDDWFELNALQELYDVFETKKTDIIEFNYRVYYEYSGKSKKQSLADQVKKDFKVELKNLDMYNWQEIGGGYLSLSCLDMHVWRRAYSAEFIHRAKPICTPSKYGEDHLFVIQAMFSAEKVVYLDRYLYNYRCRNASAVNKRSNDAFAVFENTRLLKDYLISNNLYNAVKDDYDSYILALFAGAYKKIPEDGLDKYLSMCKEIFTPDEYKKLLKRIKTNNYSFWETVFSVKNTRENEKVVKIITIAGLKIRIKPKSVNF